MAKGKRSPLQHTASVKVASVPEELIEFSRGPGMNGLPGSVRTLVAAMAYNSIAEIVLTDGSEMAERLKKHFGG